MSKFDNILVYLGSAGRARTIFHQTAFDLGAALARHGKRVIYGGMNAGSMGALAEGALRAGGHVTGVIPTRLRDNERLHRELSDLVLTETLCARKRKMFELSGAVLVLPGGYGTLDEAFEVLYWASMNQHHKPVIFLNTEHYWDSAYEQLSRSAPDSAQMCRVANTPEEIDPLLSDWPDVDAPPEVPKNIFPHFEDEVLRNQQTPIIIDEADIKCLYLLLTAVTLKQLGACTRPLGVLNRDGQFDPLLSWVDLAVREHFITEDCPKLMSVGRTEKELMAALESAGEVRIDLQGQKWGEMKVDQLISDRVSQDEEI